MLPPCLPADCGYPSHARSTSHARVEPFCTHGLFRRCPAPRDAGRMPICFRHPSERSATVPGLGRCRQRSPCGTSRMNSAASSEVRPRNMTRCAASTAGSIPRRVCRPSSVICNSRARLSRLLGTAHQQALLHQPVHHPGDGRPIIGNQSGEGRLIDSRIASRRRQAPRIERA